MSADALAAPDLSLNVRYTRDIQENRGEGEEDQVEVVQDEEHHADLQSPKARPRTQKNPAAVKRRCFSVTAVTLAVMYLLILAGLYIRYISVTVEKDELQSRYDQLSDNYSQLQEQISNVSVLYSQSQDEVKQLKDKIEVTVEKDELQSRYDQLSDNYSQLQEQISNVSVLYSQSQDEVKQLKDKIEGKWCPDGWRRFGCSCYYKSYGAKIWDLSRADCQKRGADLMVINNKEEQKFVTELNVRGESWIGLQKTWTDRGYEWNIEWEHKWVDGSPLTETFWAPGLPTRAGYWNGATCCNDQGQWTQSQYYVLKNWICEK